MKGESNIYGALGEILVWDRYKKITKYAGDYNYDLIIKGVTVEVKTKRTTVEPKPHYWATIADCTKKQNCQYYCFVRVHEEFKDAWLLGWKKPDEFFNEAIYYYKDDIDPTDPRGWQFKEDCWNLAISNLTTIE